MRRVHVLLFVLLIGLPACHGVRAQKGAIRDARIGVAVVGVGLDAADLAAAEYFEDADSADTEAYCKGEITLFILDQLATGLQGARDSIRLWETSLALYLAKKDAGEEQEADWEAVLSGEAAWFKEAVAVIAVLDMVMRYLRDAGVDLPDALEYAWSFLYGLTGRPSHGPPDLTWKRLAEGVCADYLPGGA